MATSSWRTCRGHDKMRPPKFHPNRSIGEFPTFNCVSNIMRPSAILNLNFVILDHDYEVNYAVRLPCQNLMSIRSSPLEILRFYNFASLARKCLTRSFLGLLGLNPLKLWIVIQTPKGISLGDDASFKP